MSDTPEIVQTTDQLVATLRLTVPREDIRNVMEPGIAEVMAVVTEQGVGPAGKWLTHHLRRVPDLFDFEIAVPVLAPVQPTGRVKPGVLPASRAARVTHAGGYEGLGGSWHQLMAWIEGQGFTAGKDFWEVYRVGPDASDDPDQWRTDLYTPLVA